MSTATSSSSSLRTYLITRLLLVIPMVWILVTLVFFVLRVLTDPIEAAFSGRLSQADIDARRHAAGLDKPLLEQYWHYISGVARFDFGESLTDHVQISHILRVQGAATLELTAWAVLIAFLVGVPLGRVAARYRDRLPDIGLRLFAVLAYAVPVFFVGLLLKLFFAVKVTWFFPSGRASSDVEQAINNVAPNTHIYIINAIQYGNTEDIVDVLRHTVLPAVTLGLRLFAVLAYAVPVFFVGLLLKLFFAVKVNWFFPSGRASSDVEQAINNVAPNTHIYIINAIQYGNTEDIVDVLRHTVLPAVTLGLLVAGVFLRLVRVNLLQTLRSDYVEAARARGIPESRVVRKHAFRNAMIPVVTVMGLQIAALLGGAVLTEETFEWRGIGFELAYYLGRYDYVAVQGIVTAVAVIVALISFGIDVIAALIDPRVRY